MIKYILRRVLQIVPMLFALSIVVFALIQLAPFDVVNSLTTPTMSRETVDIIRRRYGLDQPAAVQYWNWLVNVLHGDFGYSLTSKTPIDAELAVRIPSTIRTVLPAYLLALILAIAVGLYAGSRPGTWPDRIIDTLCAIGLATPTFWFALLLITLFGYYLGWLPIIGQSSIGSGGDALDVIRHLILPWSTLAFAFFPDLARYVRSSTATQMSQDYVLVQRAYQSPRRTILLHHVSRNVLLPVVTQIGLALPMMVTGAVVTETIFGLPGVGSYFLKAAQTMDYPVILAMLLLSGALVMIGNLLADVLYFIVDPRIRTGAKEA